MMLNNAQIALRLPKTNTILQGFVAMLNSFRANYHRSPIKYLDLILRFSLFRHVDKSPAESEFERVF